MGLRRALAGLCFVMTACLDDATREQPSGPLSPVAPVSHFAEVGVAVVWVDTVAIVNTGGGPTAWVARAIGGSPWLSLHDTSGVTPDTLYLEIVPKGLFVGVYRDTVIVSATTTSSTILIPVELGIAAPPPPPIDTGSNYLRFTVQPTDTKSGVVIAPPVVICLFDHFGDVVTGFDGQITMGINTGTLTGTETVTAVAGCATFADLVINAPGTYTLTGAVRPPPPSATSAPFTVTS